MGKLPTSTQEMNPLIITTLAVFSILSGCTSNQIYTSAQNWQYNECNKRADNQDREHCIDKASSSYDTYKQQTKESLIPHP
jgi:hypothetical protein